MIDFKSKCKAKGDPSKRKNKGKIKWRGLPKIAYGKGIMAKLYGEPRDSCPHEKTPGVDYSSATSCAVQADAWLDGWDSTPAPNMVTYIFHIAPNWACNCDLNEEFEFSEHFTKKDVQEIYEQWVWEQLDSGWSKKE